MAEKLKPCPFCGGEAVVNMDESWFWEWEVLCIKCGCALGHFDEREQAIEAWNRRAGEGNET